MLGLLGCHAKPDDLKTVELRSVAAVGIGAAMAAIGPESPNECPGGKWDPCKSAKAIGPESESECPGCGEAVGEKHVTCPSCGYQYQAPDHTMTAEELDERTPDEFQTEVSEEKPEAATDEGDEP